SAGAFVEAHNSRNIFIPLQARIHADNELVLMKNNDIVVDNSDNYTTLYIVNDACVALGKPLVYGSIFAFEGQLAVFNFNGGKNLRDLFPEAPTPEEVPNCDRNGVLGPLPGMIGSMMAMQVLKIITGLPVAINELTIVNTWRCDFTQLKF